MTHVLTLISNAADAAISVEIKEKYENKLKASTSNWLNENVALDIFFEGDVSNDLTTALNKEAFDFAIQEVATRRKKLLVADMDSTIICCECIDELADFIGIKDKVSHITEAAMRGEIDFKGALKERVALLKGLKVADLDQVFNERVKLNPGALTLVKTMNANGANTVLVSGGFTYFTARVSELTGFKVNRANILLHKNGDLTGGVGEPIVDSDTKINSLREFQRTDTLETHQIIAVGDGANDIPMLEGAGIGVGYHPYPAVTQVADVVINHGDLTALLYMQGYLISDFVDS
ncbi:MAG: phosphoserine phosphatase SerB [Kordiimonadaceae bacterium]|jgi:phosphoserine phosphatase|nr:phosphoserine phosphatase SerB [Kordiimonadaceae bacterium]MBT6037371.1 phosphoserine phosphatase SerB [Kordiimonadaceae bacterium]MBT6329138.1 phosphoserine phosphatase SerB [Kordiimonadaceae bacterium]MBT7582174.1 phosphoserine phosphatase SerB [Kordiimonadaceae bacterium]